MKQRFANRFFALLCGIILFCSAGAYAAEWVNISGAVYYNGQPLCVMVLANGQHIFTDMANGRYDLTLPLDEKGEITLYSFCEGLSPYKKVIKSWESRYNDIYMSPASPGSPGLTITVNQRASEKSGWVKIDGTVSWNGTPMCAMILANGQNMFSCSGNGVYDLEVPWDNDGKITFYSFCEGMLPYKEILYLEEPDLFDVQAAIKESGAKWNVKVSTMADLSTEEKKKRLGALIPSGAISPGKKFSGSVPRSGLPSSFDWRNKNGSSFVTPVKDQGGCGSCWAFAATAAIESNLMINSGQNTDLSEQIVLSCSKAGSCAGGYVEKASDFLRDTGTYYEDCYSYTATDGNCNNACSYWKNDAYKIGNLSYVVCCGNTPNSYDIKNAIYISGPVITVFAVYSDFFYYDSGVYSYVSGPLSGYHAVIITGWDDSEQCFIVKNSWGTDWGESGYFRIAYSELTGKSHFGSWTYAYSTEDNPTDRDNDGDGYTVNQGDCNDSSYNVHPGATDICGNGVDEDCNGSDLKCGNNTYTNSLGMTFKLIPAGTFMMGSPEDEPGRCHEDEPGGYSDESPQHQVTLTQAFYMQTTEITQGQWKAVMGNNPSYFQNCGDNCPVEEVSWDDIQGFITKMNQRGEGTYRLPTEAEWEYSARAGSATAFYNGGITELYCGYDQNLDAIGWYCGNSDVTYSGCYDASSWGGPVCAGTHPVSQKQANAWGLYDMSGNVWEWCSDRREAYPTGAVTNPTGPSSGSNRVLRGGSWYSHAQDCRSAERNCNTPALRDSGFGFRLALSLGQ